VSYNGHAMKAAVKPRVKICCISSVNEAKMAIELGASALGLVSEMPSGTGVIAEGRIASIAASIPPGVASFLLTSKQESASIITQQRRCRTNTLQLVDRVPFHVYREVREALPGIAIVQVIHVRGEESVDEAKSLAGYVDALLLDSGNPTLAVKELGGTGRTHDWIVSRKIREAVSVPVFLAGGLFSGNITRAVAAVEPYGVDICSGVRSDGLLDWSKLAELFRAVNSVSSFEFS